MTSRLLKKETLIVLTIIIILFLLVINNFAENRFDLIKFKDHIKSFGIWTPLVLLLLIIITSSIGLIFTIPVAAAALILGSSGAFFVSVIGLTLGASISFIMARYLGRDYFEKKYIHKMKKLEDYDQGLKKSGFLVVFYLRLISLIPYELINILGGLSRLNFKTFILATFLGIMPGTLITIYLINSTKDILSLNFFWAILLYVAFTLLPLLSRKIRRLIFHSREKSGLNKK